MKQKPRHIEPNVDAHVWCSGRWGPRRVRVTECWATLTAEDVYTALLRSRREVLQPGADGLVRMHPHAAQDGTEAFGTSGVAGPSECGLALRPSVFEVPQVPTALDAPLLADCGHASEVPAMLAPLVRFAEGQLQNRRLSRRIARLVGGS